MPDPELAAMHLGLADITSCMRVFQYFDIYHVVTPVSILSCITNLWQNIIFYLIKGVIHYCSNLSKCYHVMQRQNPMCHSKYRMNLKKLLLFLCEPKENV